MKRLFVLPVLVAGVLVAAPASAVMPVVGCDYNLDGRADLAIGIPRAEVGGIEQAGHVEVLPGTASGVGLTPLETLNEDVAGINGSSEFQDRFGSAIACGDFDGDGFDDIVIGNPHEDIGGKRDAGAISVIYGDGAGFTTSGDQIISQDTDGVAGSVNKYDRFASALAVGDFNGDGYDDIAIGVPEEDISSQSNAGTVHVLYGTSSGIRFDDDDQWNQSKAKIAGSPVPSNFFGAALAAGDFDGNGKDDLAIGVPGASVGGSADSGSVSVLYGFSAGLAGGSNEEWHLDATGVPGDPAQKDEFGAALAVGDFDGDGFDDLAVGAPGRDVDGDDEAGSVFVISGSAARLSSTGITEWNQDTDLAESPQPFDRFGETLAAADFDADTFDDLVIGVPQESNGSVVQVGGFHLVQGSASGLSTSADQFWHLDTLAIPELAGDQFATALTVGDFDGDGNADVAVGAAAYSTTAVAGGAVVILDGDDAGGVAATGFQFIDRSSIGGVVGAFERFGFALG